MKSEQPACPTNLLTHPSLEKVFDLASFSLSQSCWPSYRLRPENPTATTTTFTMSHSEKESAPSSAKMEEALQPRDIQAENIVGFTILACPPW